MKKQLSGKWQAAMFAMGIPSSLLGLSWFLYKLVKVGFLSLEIFVLIIVLFMFSSFGVLFFYAKKKDDN